MFVCMCELLVLLFKHSFNDDDDADIALRALQFCRSLLSFVFSLGFWLVLFSLFRAMYDVCVFV